MKPRRHFIRKLFGLGLTGSLIPFSSTSRANPAGEKLFIHHVFFWLKEPDQPMVRRKFEKALKKLGSIESIAMLHIGTPADTDRDVIDNTYHYSFLVGFKNREDHDIYQEHPIHDDFRNDYQDMWTRVLVYDSVDL